MNEDEDHQIERALAGPNTFGCKVPDVLERKLDQIAKDLADIKQAATKTSGAFSFTTPTTNASKTPSYALAASKHAPRPSTTAAPTPQVFRPTLHRKTPLPPPPAIKSDNTVTLTQCDTDGKELSTLNYPTLISLINSKLTKANVKEKPTDPKPIQVRPVHRHPSNDVVIYTTMAQQAESIRKQGEKWIPLLSTRMKLNLPVHTVVVHGIPASFQPADPQHLEMLTAMNTETMVPAPVFVKWISLNAIQCGASHSSICIGFANAEQARKAVEMKIFYGRYNKQTEHGRKTKPKCMNCLAEGHTLSHCKAEIMCPYCASQHPAEQCELRGKTTSNFTACARALKTADKTVDLKLLFSTTPVQLHHSPLDPKCPTRLAIKKNESLKAAAATTEPTTASTPQVRQPRTAAVHAEGPQTAAPASATPPAATRAAGGNDAQMTIAQ